MADYQEKRRDGRAMPPDAERTGSGRPGTDVFRRMATFADRQGLWKRGESILVAVSGGADSVALLHLLRRLSPLLDLDLRVVHLDHGLRGEAAKDDARWVRELAGRLNISCIAERRDVPAAIRKTGRSPEDAARMVRYEFFREVSERTGIAAVALGHHADDQAETLLLRLLRGGGPGSLGGMRPARKEGNLSFIRPLLSIRRGELRDYLEGIGEPFREDASNRDHRYLRNRIRHRLLPLLEADYSPRIREILVHLAEMEGERDDFLRDRLRPLFASVDPGTGPAIDCALFQGLTRFEQGEMLREFLRKAGVENAHRRHVKNLERIIGGQSGRRLNVGGPGVVLKEHDRLIVVPRAAPGSLHPWRLAIPGEAVIGEIGARLIARQYPRPAPLVLKQEVGLKKFWESYPRGRILREYLDRERVVPPLTVRSRLPGDRYSPLGMKGSRKIKEIMINARVPLSRRDLIPVIEDGEKIIWLAGYRPEEGCRVRDETKTILEISLVPE
ncbi:MAG: tRNA lysidine(34) synthetase TilS [PVC group bacterium]